MFVVPSCYYCYTAERTKKGGQMHRGKRLQLRGTKDEAQLNVVRRLKSIEFDDDGKPTKIWTHRQNEPDRLTRGAYAVRGYLSDVQHSSGNIFKRELAGAPYIEGRARLASTLYLNDSGLVGLFTFQLKLNRSTTNEFRSVRFAEPVSFVDKSEWDEYRKGRWGNDIPSDAHFISLATDFTFGMWRADVDLPCEMFDRLHDAIRLAGQKVDIQLSVAIDCYATASEHIVLVPWHGVLNVVGISVTSLDPIAPFSQRMHPDHMTEW